MLKAVIKKMGDRKEYPFKGDYLIIQDEHGNEWQFFWNEDEEDGIDIFKQGKNARLRIETRAANYVAIS